MTETLFAADLFCGAGGSSTGLLQAAQELGLNLELIAVNHWEMAIATHSANHPAVKHFNSDLADIDPLKVVPGGKLRLLVASPECTHFSRARGGKPMSKQSRASIKYILRWVSALDVQDVLIENVPEFQDWGPLYRSHSKGCQGAGKCLPLCHFETPIKNRKGEYFRRFLNKMGERGYQVKWQVLNAADYGDPTTRKRLFIRARKGQTPQFPAASHHAHKQDLFGTYPVWKPAREIIDWSIKGESIFGRKRPLAPNTMRRIVAGLQKFGGKAFVIGQQSGAAPRGVDEPLPTVAGAISFCEPFILPLEGVHRGNAPRSIDKPLPTITSRGGGALIQPFIVPFHSEHTGQTPRTHSIEEPMPTVVGSPTFGLVEPFLVSVGGPEGQGRNPHSVNEPLGTVMPGDHRALVEPFIMAVNHGADDRRSYSVENPMPTVTSVDAWALVEPFLVMLNGTKEDQLKASHRSVKEPMPTVTSSGHFGLVEPFLVEYYGTGGATSVDEPLKTQTGRDRFGLVQPMLVQDAEGRKYMIDILFRMLRPHELAAAMSFPKDYAFSGNREQIVKQIGNAVPVNLAKALCRQALSA